MAKSNDTDTVVEYVLVPVVRNENGVDIDGTYDKALGSITQYAEKDASGTASVVSAVKSILTDEKRKSLNHFSASTLAKMSLMMMGEIPTDKLEKETCPRVEAYLNSQAGLLHIARGRNAGYWIKDRLKSEELAKLVKDKTAT